MENIGIRSLVVAGFVFSPPRPSLLSNLSSSSDRRFIIIRVNQIRNIVAIVVDEKIADMDRGQRIQAMNLPVGLGDEDRVEYFYGIMDNVVHHTLKEAPEGYQAAKLKTALEWDEPAMVALMKVPAMVRNMVMTQTEKHARSQGATRVTATHMRELAEEFGMDEAVLSRFGRKADG